MGFGSYLIPSKIGILCHKDGTTPRSGCFFTLTLEAWKCSFVALSFGFAIAESSPSGFASHLPINLSGKIAKAKHNKKQKTCDNDIYEGEPT